jgi:exosortase
MDKVLLTLVFLLIATAFIPIYPAMFDKWISDSNNSHGIFIPFISGYLIYLNKENLRILPVRSEWKYLLLSIVFILIYLFGLVTGILLVSRVSFVLTLISLALALFGFEIFRRLRFPLFFLLFMIPFPDSFLSMMSMPLKQFATVASTWILGIIGVPVYSEGNMMHFANTSLEVAEACSGIRSIISFLTLGILFAYFLEDEPTWKKAIGIASAVPLALIVNIVRVVGTGWIASAYGRVVANEFLHEASGLLVFFMGITIYYLSFRLVCRRSVKNG